MLPSSANSVGFDVGATISPIDGSLLGDMLQVYSVVFELEESAGYFVRKLPKRAQKISCIEPMYCLVSN